MAKPDPESVLDHFKVWEIEPQPAAHTIRVQGQFDRAARPTRTEQRAWLANPVKKNGSALLHPEWHLTGYALEQVPDQPKRWVVLTNQFHRKPVEWHLTDPAMILLPASKVLEGRPPPYPTELDHFVCYLVVGAEPVTQKVVLVDQFDELREEKKEEIARFEPAFFCVPVLKTEDGKEPPREHRLVQPDAHLALYDLTPTTEFKRRVFTQDQFGRGELDVTRSLMLAVPSTKVRWGQGDSQPTAAG
jgi:hypothetical protein